MKILVIGGRGNVGSHVVKELLKRNVDVSVLMHSEEKEVNFPEAVHGIQGDLLDPKTVRTVFDGIDRVFLLLPMDQKQTAMGLYAINGAVRAGVKRIVYMSVVNVEKNVIQPNVGQKLAVEEAVKASGIPYTILRPNSFFQNDLMVKDVLLNYGVYPVPLGDIGSDRIDVRDIAEAAAVALTTDDYLGKTINLVGPDRLNGQKMAELWSEALGKPIVYGGHNLDAWEAQMLQFMPPWVVFELKIMFEDAIKNGQKGQPGDVEQVTKLLGHAPRHFTEFAQEMAAQWKVRS